MKIISIEKESEEHIYMFTASRLLVGIPVMLLVDTTNSVDQIEELVKKARTKLKKSINDKFPETNMEDIIDETTLVISKNKRVSSEILNIVDKQHNDPYILITNRQDFDVSMLDNKVKNVFSIR